MTRLGARRCLLTLLWLGAVSAAIGGVLGVVFNGAGMPLDYLEGTPFDTYVGPGLILGVVVGGTQLAAALTTHSDRSSSAVFTAIAGFGMIIWIFAELAILAEFSWLQVVYFGLGICEVVLLLLLQNASSASSRVRQSAAE